MGQQKEAFRGWFIPVNIVDLYKTGVITDKEMLILATIDSFVTKEEGCYASNTHLARLHFLKEDRVSKIIAKLKRLELVIQTKSNGRKRWLETCYSNTVTISQTNGEHLVCDVLEEEATEQTNGEHLPRLSVPTPKCIHNTNKKFNSTTLSRTPSASSVETTEKTKLATLKNHPRWLSYAKKLATGIYQIRKVNYTSKVKGWAKSFLMLHTKEEVPVLRIRAVLEWYCNELPKKSQWLPVAHSGGAFRSKFINIENAMQKMEGDAQEEKEANRTYELPEHLHLTLTIAEEKFKMIGLSIFTRQQLPKLLWEQHHWQIGVWEALKELQQEYRDENYPLTAIDGVYYYVEDVLRELGEPYIDWLAKQIISWEDWGGDMSAFLPGGKHHIRFINMVLKRHNRPTEKILLEAFHCVDAK